MSAANERGDFLPLPLSFASHDRMRALSVLRCFPSARQQPCSGFMQCRQKAMRPAWLAKIPPLACGQSAPFDKGVNRAAALSPRESARKRTSPGRTPGLRMSGQRFFYGNNLIIFNLKT